MVAAKTVVNPGVNVFGLDDIGGVLYALLDADQSPIYVGHSTNLPTRLSQHRRRPWWPEVRFVTWHLTTDDRWRRESFEAIAIESLTPTYNDAHNRGRAVAAQRARQRRRRLKVTAYYEDTWIEAIATRRLGETTFKFVRVAPGPISGWRSAR